MMIFLSFPNPLDVHAHVHLHAHVHVLVLVSCQMIGRTNGVPAPSFALTSVVLFASNLPHGTCHSVRMGTGLHYRSHAEHESRLLMKGSSLGEGMGLKVTKEIVVSGVGEEMTLD